MSDLNHYAIKCGEETWVIATLPSVDPEAEATVRAAREAAKLAKALTCFTGLIRNAAGSTVGTVTRVSDAPWLEKHVPDTLR